MAIKNIYVAKPVAEGIYPAGNDTTGDGTITTPYATAYKAFTVAADGDSVLVAGSATPYAENWSSTGYMYLNGKNFTTPVTVKPWTAGDVVQFTGTSGNTYNVRIINSSGITFDGIDVLCHGSSTNGLRIDCYHNSTSRIVIKNMAVAGSVAVECDDYGTDSVSDITLDNVRSVYAAGTALSIGWTGATGNVNNIALANSSFSGTWGAYIFKTTGVKIDGSTFIGTTSYGLLIGSDAYGMTSTTTGYVRNSSINSHSSHAFCIGAGASNFDADNNVINGGDYCFVIKGNDGVRVTRNLCYSTSDHFTSPILFKWCTNATAQDNWFIATQGSCIRLEDSDSTYKHQNITITDNRIIASGTASIIVGGGAAYDNGGVLLDRNWYSLTGSGTWGTVYGTACADLAAAKVVWAAYGKPYNDTNPYRRPRTEIVAPSRSCIKNP